MVGSSFLNRVFESLGNIEIQSEIFVAGALFVLCMGASVFFLYRVYQDSKIKSEEAEDKKQGDELLLVTSFFIGMVCLICGIIFHFVYKRASLRTKKFRTRMGKSTFYWTIADIFLGLFKR